MIFTDLANELKLCYTYDTLSRVIKRTAVSLDNSKTIISTENFNYDDAGNLTTDGFEYDSSNRLTMYNNVVVYYDPDGNMVCSSLGEGFFDSSNRLTSFNTTSYDYDVENIRVRKTYGETVTTYTYNANSKLSQLLMKTENNVATKYVYGLGLIYETTETDCKVYHYDYRGSTVALTDTNGNVIDTFAYDTYGKLLTRTGTTVTPFLYNGRDGVMSDENGLVYMRARYYSPTFKRFINADVVAGSITNSITLNRYAYANGNPVSNVDPFGLSPDEARGTQGTAISTDSGNNVFDISDWYTDEISNALHTLLDLAGFIPGFGAIADGLNAVIYALEGDWANAGMSAFAALPGLGDIAAGCKWARKFFKASSKIGKALDSVSTILSKTDEMMAAMTSFGKIGDNLSFVAKNGDETLESTMRAAQKGTDGFDSYYYFKKEYGKARDGYEWHHIVEQNQIKNSGFDAKQIYNIHNTIPLSKAQHRQVSSYYSRIQSFTDGKTFRKWLAGQPYEEQYKWGINVLKDIGVDIG